ncbi:ribosomal L7Ae/L30e/S12e/Gadd45 family protein [Papillibacter cinnamivorans]|uniref:Large subunit ribosomal protein L7A n=1 Tax=Papillibacter cinnamivorans DSM 12816 TaxID=1122930 RepID=A0A1W1ZEU9_9FIRM|nr:ribosomal L7Ae/L30e/S12e/Gadd45 family protein [Papillibacter cinnamivorans]SMC47000.1 large subunit ribosomal protein L7A [Papillibacter cinnamivorans DSM 12816]
MLSLLSTGKKVIGIKQSRKAIREGAAERAFLAQDADPEIRETMGELCQQHGVPAEAVPTMLELGRACGIEVGAAAAVLLK